jgi:hypothetical protein
LFFILCLFVCHFRSRKFAMNVSIFSLRVCSIPVG